MILQHRQKNIKRAKRQILFLSLYTVFWTSVCLITFGVILNIYLYSPSSVWINLALLYHLFAFIYYIWSYKSNIKYSKEYLASIKIDHSRLEDGFEMDQVIDKNPNHKEKSRLIIG